MKTIGKLEGKIAEFRREIGDRELVGDEKTVFDAFCRTKGHDVHWEILDRQNRYVHLVVKFGRTSEGPAHILLKHYNEPVGRVTAIEILDMLHVVTEGRRYDGHGHYEYRLKRKRGNVEYVLGVKIAKEGDILKSFYSNRKR